MINRSSLSIVALAVVGALVGLLAGQWLQPRHEGHAAHALVGSLGADFERPDLDGKPHRPSEWSGRLVVLNFWASWCGPCVEEMPLLDRAQQRLAGRGLQVVGIAADSEAATKAFLDEHPVRYPILVDDPEHGEDLSLDYGNTRSVLPYTVLIGRDGRILAQRFGNFSESGLEQWLAPHL